jgi:uncharacterized membrane protein
LYHRPGDYLVTGMDMASIYSDREIEEKEIKNAIPILLPDISGHHNRIQNI